jgi:hypothetical protein
VDSFFHFIQNYEAWFYVLFGAVALLYLRKLIQAFQEMRSSIFGLERENAQRKISFSMTVVGLSGSLALVVFVLNSFVAPALPKLHLLRTPTIDVLATQTATLPQAEANGKQQTPLASQSGTPSGTSLTQTVTPTLVAEGCIPNQLEWTSPKTGDELSGTVVLKGTVDVLNLGFYKYEYSPAGSNKWFTIAAGNKVVKNDELGRWNTSQVVPGDYQLRLVVSDNTNKLMPACVVPVKITQP